MKNTYILIFIAFLIKSLSGVYSQEKRIHNPSVYKTVPQERIFLHYNSSFVLSGERIYYKVYNVNDKTNELSSLSKIAYVELIDKNYKVVLKQKVWLDSGSGQGDFFVPFNLNSGAYKIVAYTNWMKNREDGNFFHGDVSIVNPFSDNSGFILSKTTSENKNLQHYISRDAIKKNSPILLDLEKKEYAKRELVSLNITTNDKILFDGKYSISVRKLDEVLFKKPKTSNYTNIYESSNTSSNQKNKIVIPEFKGELISGKVVNSSNEPISDINVSLSIPGKDYIFRLSRTDDNGNFYFNIDRRHNFNNVIVQIIKSNSKEYNIVLNKHTPLNYNNLTFKNIALNEEVKKSIIRRSIHSQIENAYQSLKQDSLISVIYKDQFYGTKNYMYLLDNFKRFKTLRETIVEIIGELYYIEKDNQTTIRIRKNDGSLSKNDKPLVLVDGVFIKDHSSIIDFDAKRIKRITVVREDYMYGALYFSGLVDIKTFDGDFLSSPNVQNINQIPLQKLEPLKKYHKADYGNKALDFTRTPDFRNQLLWNPMLKLDKEKTKIDFYTSDLVGTYEISLEGFGKNGKPVSIISYFKVK